MTVIVLMGDLHGGVGGGVEDCGFEPFKPWSSGGQWAVSVILVDLTEEVGLVTCGDWCTLRVDVAAEQVDGWFPVSGRNGILRQGWLVNIRNIVVLGEGWRVLVLGLDTR